MSKISDSIIHDHKELKEYYGKIKSANDDDTKTRWRNQFVWELARHSIAEELVVYPAMEKYIKPNGHDMAEKDRQEHQVVNSVHGALFNREGQKAIVPSPGHERQQARV
jgi:endo-1,4-beta-xylanase